jgi:hypothetical protein
MKALLALLATVTLAQADDDPFAMLKDPKRTWSFEIVTGPSVDKLTRIKHAADATTVCTVAEVKPYGAITRSSFSCKTNAYDDAITKIMTRATPFLYLAFDDDGVRQVYGRATEAELADQTNVAGFTFPRVLVNGKWTLEAKSEKRRAKVAVRETKLRVAGKTQKVWMSDVKVWDAQTNELTRDDAAAFLPGVGLALLCSHDVGKDAREPAWMCARLIGSMTTAAP